MLRPEFYVVLFLFRFHASLLFLRKHHTLLAVWEDGGNLTLTEILKGNQIYLNFATK